MERAVTLSHHYHAMAWLLLPAFLTIMIGEDVGEAILLSSRSPSRGNVKCRHRVAKMEESDPGSHRSPFPMAYVADWMSNDSDCSIRLITVEFLEVPKYLKRSSRSSDWQTANNQALTDRSAFFLK